MARLFFAFVVLSFGLARSDALKPLSRSDNFYDPDKDEYNLEQAIADKTQENTIAYSGLAYMTGGPCEDSFIPPGKVADYFSFQYLRDNTDNGMGHNTDFLTNCANNVLAIMTDEQVEQVIATAKSQAEPVAEYAYGRIAMLTAFRENMEGVYPEGKTELAKGPVVKHSEDLYVLDAAISLERAKLFGDIIKSLDETQTDALDAMVVGGFASWEPLDEQIDKTQLTHEEHVLVMTLASEFFGWYGGSVETDTYFCPERHGTYFGSFFMKDAPALAAQELGESYTIDEQITGDKGEMLLAYLEDDQSQLISDIVDLQRENLLGIVSNREAISTELRKLWTQDTIDEDAIYTLAKQYGAYDGENVFFYAKNFAAVENSLTDEQRAYLMELRDLEEYTCDSSYIYVYSTKVETSSIDSKYFENHFLFR